MAYTPDPNDIAAPLDTELAETAAAEFRTLKSHIKDTIAAIQISGDPYAPDRMKWLGDYDAATAYIKNDIVSFGTIVYICIQGNTGEALTDEAFWDVMIVGESSKDLLLAAKDRKYAGLPSHPLVTVPADKSWLRDTASGNFPFYPFPNPAMGHVVRPKAVSYTDLFTCWLNEERQFCVRGNTQGNHLAGSATGSVDGITVINNFSSKYGRMQSGDRFMQLHGTFNGMFALTEKGDVFFCGFDADGMNGSGTSGNTFVWTKVPYVGAHVTESGLPVDIVAMHIGWDSSYGAEPANNSRTVYAIDSSGRLWVWGNNNEGQLGVGDLLQKDKPELVAGVSDIEMVSSSGYHTLIVDSSGNLFVSGRGNYGQLGNNSLIVVSTFVQVTGVGFAISSPVVQIIAKGYSGACSFILTEDGNLYGTGYNLEGQLGDTSTVNKSVFTRSGTQSFSSVYVAGDTELSVYALDGTPAAPSKAMYSWGYNSFGQVGQGNVVSPVSVVSRPVASSLLANTTAVVDGVLSQVAELFSRDAVDLIIPVNECIGGNKSHSVLVVTGTKVWFWGYNYGLDTEGAVTIAGSVSSPMAIPLNLNTFDGYDGIKPRNIVDFCHGGQAFGGLGVFLLALSDGAIYGTGYNGSRAITDDVRTIDQFTPLQS